MYNKLHREVIRDPRIFGLRHHFPFLWVSIVWTPFSYKRRVYTKGKKTWQTQRQNVAELGTAW